jgi:nucleotide-binding universal stress UspA family protein
MRILYATDGTRPALEGERLITSLFDREAGNVHVFSVTPEAALLNSLETRYDMERLDLPPLNSEQVAERSADHLSGEGFIVSSSCTRGNPAQEILRVLEGDRYDLVVLGASHTSWVGNVLLGSVSTHVLHHSPCPVVVTHRAPTGSGRILLGIDGSAESHQTTAVAARVLDRNKCSFTVACVVPQPWISAVHPPVSPFAGYSDYQRMAEQQMARAWQLVESAQMELGGAGFKTEGAVLSGSAGPQLLKEAENISADLVVVGARGLGPVKRTILGSVSDQVVRHAPATLVGRFPTK